MRAAYGVLMVLGVVTTNLLHNCVWNNAAGDTIAPAMDTDLNTGSKSETCNVSSQGSNTSDITVSPAVSETVVRFKSSAGDNDEGRDDDNHGDKVARFPRLCRYMLGAAAMVRERHGQLLLLAPYEISFGLMAALMLHHVNGSVAKAAVGEQNVSLSSAVLPATAAIVAPACGAACERGAFNNPAALLLGIFAFLLELAALHSLSLPGAVPSASLLLIIYALHGVGRATFESANKALVADLFGSTGDVGAAFACIVALSGGASAVGFFVFPHMSVVSMLRLCEVSTVVAALCQLKIWKLHSQKKLDVTASSKLHNAGPQDECCA